MGYKITLKGQPIGHKDLNNGFTQVVDPVKSITDNMLTTYSDKMDRFVFENLDTENNFIHVEEITIPEMDVKDFYSYKATFRMIATVTNKPIFEREAIISIQDLRTYFHEYNVPYKDISFEDFKSIVSKLIKL